MVWQDKQSYWNVSDYLRTAVSLIWEEPALPDAWEGGKLLNCHNRISCGTPMTAFAVAILRNNEMNLCLSQQRRPASTTNLALLLIAWNQCCVCTSLDTGRRRK